MTTTSSDDRLLGIYLNDHLAGATAGVELAKRMAGGKHGQVMEALAGEIAEDRDALKELMTTLDVPVRTYKALLGWTAEKVGRFKPNGRLLFNSPSSRVLELEALLLGIEGKAALWRSLRVRAAGDARLPDDRLGELLDRARRQAVEVERLRVSAVAEVFGGEADAPVTNG